MNLAMLGQWGACTEAARYQEDACRVLMLIWDVYGQKQVTVGELHKALVDLSLDLRSLYRQLSAGYETPQLKALAEALGLPEKSLWCRPPQPLSFEQAMAHLVNQAGNSAAEIEQVSEGILRMASEPPQPTKRKEKIPYYQKGKQQWWKGKRCV